MPSKPKHADPHFNADGGCLCLCRRCVRVNLTPVKNDAEVVIRQRCCCKDCNEECDGDRYQSAYVPTEIGKLRERKAHEAAAARHVRLIIADADNGEQMYDGRVPVGGMTHIGLRPTRPDQTYRVEIREA